MRRCKRHGLDPWVRKITLEEETATHSSVLDWEIPWSEEPGRLQSTGLQRVGHDRARTHTCITFSITKVNDHHLINYHFIYLSILWRPSTDDLDMTSVSPPPPTRPTPTLPWSPRWHLPSHLPGNSLVVQWLGLHTFTAEEAGSVPGRGTYKLWHALPSTKKNYPSHLPFTSPIQIANHHTGVRSSLPTLRPEVCRIYPPRAQPGIYAIKYSIMLASKWKEW